MPPKNHAPRTAKTWNGAPVLLRSPFFSEHAKLLEQYTSRDMTKSSDILDGMYGLLKVLEHTRRSQSPPGSLAFTYLQDTGRGGRTLYGLPEEFLYLALFWQPPAAAGTYLTKRSNDVLPAGHGLGGRSVKILQMVRKMESMLSIPVCDSKNRSGSPAMRTCP